MSESTNSLSQSDALDREETLARRVRLTKRIAVVSFVVYLLLILLWGGNSYILLTSSNAFAETTFGTVPFAGGYDGPPGSHGRHYNRLRNEVQSLCIAFLSPMKNINIT